MLGFDGGNAGGVDAAHLAGADTDGLAAFGVDDGIGFDELGNLPGEHQIVDFLLGWRTLGDYLQVIYGDHAGVAALYQQAAIDTLVVPVSVALGAPFAALEAYRPFGRQG